MTTENQNDENVSRRGVLRSGATLSGIGLVGIPQLDFNSRNKVDEVNLVEVALVHDLPNFDSINRAELPVRGHDGVVKYFVDEEKHRLALTEWTREEMQNTIRSHSTVTITHESVHSTPTTLYDRTLPYVGLNSGHELNVPDALVVAEDTEYEPPKAEVQYSDSDVAVVQADGQRLEVSSQDEQVTTLDTREVTIRRPRQSIKEVADPRQEGETTLTRGLGNTETITVEPNLIIRNSGKMEV
jgi:hypothetical protein